MRYHLTAVAAGLSLLVAGAAPALAQEAGGTVISADGDEIGTVTLTQTPQGVLVKADIEGLPQGLHGFHIHETGACDAADGFKSAGGHYAAGKSHGFLVEGGPHPGDMPNVAVGADGHLQVEVYNTRISIDGETPILDEDGSALMIHSGPDDYSSQPSGDAGSRIACAVLE